MEYPLKAPFQAAPYHLEHFILSSLSEELPLTLNQAYQRFRRFINRCNLQHRNSCRRAGYRAVPGWLHAAGGGVRGVVGAVSPTPLTAGMLSALNCRRGFRCWFVSPSVLLFSEQCVWQAWFLKTSVSYYFSLSNICVNYISTKIIV